MAELRTHTFYYGLQTTLDILLNVPETSTFLRHINAALIISTFFSRAQTGMPFLFVGIISWWEK